MNEEPPTREVSLLYAWREGDRSAGDELMRTYYPQVMGFFRLRVPTAADDLTQRTFLACTEARDRVRASTFRAYLFGIARRLLAKHLADDRRVEELSTISAVAPQSLLSPSRVVAARQEHWLLLRALEGMPQEQQLGLVLFYVQGLRAREVAEVLEVSTTTVTTRLSRAREALRDRVAALRAPARIREAVLGDLDGWVRSIGALALDNAHDR